MECVIHNAASSVDTNNSIKISYIGDHVPYPICIDIVSSGKIESLAISKEHAKELAKFLVGVL